MMKRQYRQGDVLLHPIAALPSTAKRVTVERRIVLAEGEVTGHAHAIEATPDVELYELEGTLYLRVLETVPLKHEEHAEIAVSPGTYEVKRQVEEWMDEVRRVAD